MIQNVSEAHQISEEYTCCTNSKTCKGKKTVEPDENYIYHVRTLVKAWLSGTFQNNNMSMFKEGTMEKSWTGSFRIFLSVFRAFQEQPLRLVYK